MPIQRRRREIFPHPIKRPPQPRPPVASVPAPVNLQARGRSLYLFEFRERPDIGTVVFRALLCRDMPTWEALIKAPGTSEPATFAIRVNGELVASKMSQDQLNAPGTNAPLKRGDCVEVVLDGGSPEATWIALSGEIS